MNRLQSLYETPHPVVLVTGSGAPRVGNVVARHFASLGCAIALHANRSTDRAEQTATELRGGGTEVLVTQGAVEVPEEVQRIIEEVMDRFGRIDVLVNSAAIWQPRALEEITAEEVRRYWEVNTLGSFWAARTAGLRMIDQPRGGAIVQIGDWALGRPYLDHAAYFPSKGALEVMTRSLAVELGERNRRVRVNCIHPGPVLLAQDMPEEKRRAVANSTLLKRVGTPEHVAHAAQFLVENDFVTGVMLPVDGGRTIYADDGMQTHHRTG